MISLLRSVTNISVTHCQTIEQSMTLSLPTLINILKIRFFNAIEYSKFIKYLNDNNNTNNRNNYYDNIMEEDNNTSTNSYTSISSTNIANSSNNELVKDLSSTEQLITVLNECCEKCIDTLIIQLIDTTTTIEYRYAIQQSITYLIQFIENDGKNYKEFVLLLLQYIKISLKVNGFHTAIYNNPSFISLIKCLVNSSMDGLLPREDCRHIVVLYIIANDVYKLNSLLLSSATKVASMEMVTDIWEHVLCDIIVQRITTSEMADYLLKIILTTNYTKNIPSLSEYVYKTVLIHLRTVWLSTISSISNVNARIIDIIYNNINNISIFPFYKCSELLKLITTDLSSDTVLNFFHKIFPLWKLFIKNTNNISDNFNMKGYDAIIIVCSSIWQFLISDRLTEPRRSAFELFITSLNTEMIQNSIIREKWTMVLQQSIRIVSTKKKVQDIIQRLLIGNKSII
jgi:hypothetical protein